MFWEDLKTTLAYPILSIHNFQLTPYHLLALALFFLLGKILAWIAKNIIRRILSDKPGFTARRETAIVRLIQYVIYTLTFIVGLQTVGINVTVLVAGSTAILVALGLGMQGLVNEFFSGLVLLFEGAVSVGDVIEVDAKMGIVTDVGIRSCKIQTRNGVSIIVPNSKFITGVVVNYNHDHPFCGFNLRIGVDYDCDTKLVTRLLTESTYAVPRVRKEPSVSISIKDFGEFAVIFDILFYTDDVLYGESVKSDIRYVIFDVFRKNNVRIPFPQREIRVLSDSSGTDGLKQ